MKRYISTLFLIAIFSIVLRSQTVITGKIIEESSAKTASYIYKARDAIFLRAGFSIDGKAGYTLSAYIDQTLSFPVTYQPSQVTESRDLTSKVCGSTNGVFDVSATGAATYNVPIEVPAGYNGMQPQLSISYNSQSGDGLLGWGWNLNGLSSIVRGISKIYENAYVDPIDYPAIANGDDRFYYNGQLMYGPSSGIYHQDRTKYRLQNNPNIVIEAFDVDGADAKIDHFKAYSSDGSLYEFGYGSNSTVFYTGQGLVRCFLTKVSDVYGNYISYTYKKDANEIYIDEINYSNKDNSRITKIKFLYETYNGQTIGYAGVVSNRNLLLNKIVIRNFGEIIKEYQFNYYQNFNTYLSEIIEKDSQGRQFNSLAFNWGWTAAPGADISLLYTYDMRAAGNLAYDTKKFTIGDIDNNGAMDIMHQKYGWENWNMRVNLGTGMEIEIPNSSGFGSCVISDFNGDGKNEVAFFKCSYKTNQTVYYRGQSSYGMSGMSKSSKIDFYNWQSGQLVKTSSLDISGYGLSFQTCDVLFGDFNGDFITDLFFYAATNAYLFIGTSTGAFTYYASGVFEATGEPFIGDYNGDGRSEILLVKSSGAVLYQLDQATPSPVISAASLFKYDGISYYDKLRVADINGDGNTDIIEQEHASGMPDGFDVHKTILSTGTNFITSSSSCLDDLFEGWDKFNDYQFTEANGDNRNDIFEIRRKQLSGPNNFQLALCRGNSIGTALANTEIDKDLFSGNKILSNNYTYVEYYNSGDFNGDGRTDYMAMFNTVFVYDPAIEPDSYWLMYGGAINWTYYEDLFEQDYGRPALGNQLNARFLLVWSDRPTTQQCNITKIIDGYNNVTNIVYRPEYSVESESYGNDNVCSITTPINLVYYYQIPDGLGGMQRINMSYSTPRLQRTGAGFLGFKKVTSTNTVTGLKVENVYNYKIGNIMFPNIATTTTYVESTKISTQTNSWSVVCDEGEQRAMPYLSSALNKDELKGLTVTTTNLYNEIPRLAGDLEGLALPYETQVKYGNDYNKSVTRTTNQEYLDIPNANGRFLLRILNQQTEKELDDSRTDKITLTTRYTYSGYTPLPEYIIENEGSQYQTKKHYVRNTDGTVTREGLYAKNEAGTEVFKYTTFTLDPTRTYVVEEINESNTAFKTKYLYYNPRGLLLEKTDPNALKTEYSYGYFDRIASVREADGTINFSDYKWSYMQPDAPSGAKIMSSETSASGSSVRIFYNALGQELRRVTNGFSGDIYTDIEYNAKGQVIKQSTPYYEGTGSGSVLWTTTEYYSDGRVQRITRPGNNIAYYTYSGANSSINVNGVLVTKTMDAQGLITKSVENGKTINFTRQIITESGQPYLVEKSTSADAATVETKSDILGRKISLKDPDAGTYSYTYDGFGQILKEIKPNLDYVKYAYDEVGRLLSETWYNNAGTQLYIVQTNYDLPNALGVIETISSDKHTLNYTYDDLLRLKSVTETIVDASLGNKIFTKSYEYDVYSRISKEYYPQNLTLQNVYSNDFLSQIKNVADGSIIWQASKYDALDRVTERTDGSSVITKWTYTNNFPTNLTIEKSGTKLTEINYTWNISKSRLEQKVDKSIVNGTSRTLTEVYTYDAINRLEKTTVNGTTLFDIDYDANSGNITNHSNIGSFSYTNTAHKHAVSRVDDTNGLMAYGRAITYTSFNKVSHITQENGKNLDIVYGSDYQRIKSEYTLTGTRQWSRYYALGNVELVIQQNNSSVYYVMLNAPDGLYAIAEKTGSSAFSLNYMHTDYQGTIISETWPNSSNYIVFSYDAWGRKRNATTGLYAGAPTNWLFPRGYTGHEHIDDFGLINMNGRMYDPLLCRFISPDNYIQNPYGIDSYNRYVYCLNNPLLFIDPSGEYALIDDVVAMVVGGVVNLGMNLIQGNVTTFGQGIGYFITGVAAGEATLYGGPLAGGAVLGLGNNLTAQISQNGLHNINWGQAALSTGIGVATSYLGGQISNLISPYVSSLLSGISNPIIYNALNQGITNGISGFSIGTGLSLASGNDINTAFRDGAKGGLFGFGLGTMTGTIAGYKMQREMEQLRQLTPLKPIELKSLTYRENLARTDLKPEWKLGPGPRGYAIEEITINEQYPSFTHTPYARTTDGYNNNAVVSFKSTMAERIAIGNSVQRLAEMPSSYVKILHVITPPGHIPANWNILQDYCIQNSIVLRLSHY